jgi:hypothetical protein
MTPYNRLAFDNGAYINTYAGIPLDQVQKTADTLSQRHYQNLASASQLQILANQMKSKALPGAKGYFDDQIGEIQGALEDMAKNGGENSTAKINAMATRFQGDQNILNAMQRRQEYDKQTAMIDELTANNQQPLYDQARREALANAKAGDEIYNTPYSSQVEGYLDPVKEREDIWKVINPDSYEGEIRAALKTAPAELIGQAFSGENPDLPMFFETISNSGISGKKVKEMLDNAMSTYKNTKSYRQQTGNLIGKNDKAVEKEMLEQGLMRVYNNLKREYRNTPNWAGRGSEESTNQSLRTPMNAKAREAFNAGNLDPYTTLDKTALEVGAQEMEKARTMSTNDKDRQYYADMAVKMRKEQAQPDSVIQARRTDMFKTAMMDAGQDPSRMSDEQIAAASNTPAGTKMLKDYLGRVGGERLQYPVINNILSNSEATERKGLAKRTALDREFIDLDTGEKIGRLKDENGKMVDAELADALQKGDFEIQGTVDPQHILSDMDPDGENFIRGERAAVYLKDGKVRNVMMSAMPGTTSSQDVNENVLYNQAMDLPGRWSKLSNGMEVMKPSSPQMANILYEQYIAQPSDKPKITREQFAQAAAIVKEDGKIKPATDFTVIAQDLASRGIKLKRQK